MKVVSKYEVGCEACGVSYPPEQKRCIHCGARTSPLVVEVPGASHEFMEGVVPAPPEHAVDVHRAPGGELVFLPSTGGPAEEPPAPSRMRQLSTLIWIVIAVAITVVRACFGE